MKLATLDDGTRDGLLAVVSRDLARCVRVRDIVPTLQAALDDWPRVAPLLAARSDELNARHMDGAEPFDAGAARAPLPRAYQWVDGSAYVNHVDLVRRARGAVMPEQFWTDPLMYQGASDHMLGACEDIVHRDAAFGIDFEAEVAVITSDVPMGTPVADALAHVRLITLVNDVSLRNLVPGELAKGFGFLQSKPASA
ncbi:MAG: fumarylacetoacetate hydrolase family protein, partial [Casimicrobiaceae bacterium]